MKSTSKNIDTKLNAYLSYLSEREKMILLDMAQALAGKEAEAQTPVSAISAKELAELDRRWEDYKKGKGKTYSWEEVKQELNKKLKTIKR